MANCPSEGSRATRDAIDDPSRENIRRYLRVHIDDESVVTDELVDYIHYVPTWSLKFIEARRQSVSMLQDYTPELAGIQGPVLLIHGRYDLMVAFEVSIAILNHIEDSRLVLLHNCKPLPPTREAGGLDGAGARVPAGVLRGTASTVAQRFWRTCRLAPRLSAWMRP
jgi:pimeloyl-ACP methyl ester carboxylesterase